MEKRLTKIINVLFLIVLFVLSYTLVTAKINYKGENIIYIDPGHGGPDGGAVGIDGLYEKDIVLDIAKKLKFYLNNAGYNVLLTRDGDYDLADDNSKNKKREDIHNRVRLINEANCMLYVSIHANKYSSPKIYGSQTFYRPNDEKAKLLSEEIMSALKEILRNTKREAKVITGKYLIEHASPPGSLVEVGFLSNPEEAKLLTDPYYQEKVAYAIYVGILSYIEKINK